MSQINFYILPSTKPLILFVCQLTQTVLAKNTDGILIMTPSAQLQLLDDMLWSFNDTAFIPHDIIPTEQTLADVNSAASVLLTDQLDRVSEFDGVVINLTSEPLLMYQGTKLLEIISADEESIVAGRKKYRAYQTSFPQLTIQTFKI